MKRGNELKRNNVSIFEKMTKLMEIWSKSKNNPQSLDRSDSYESRESSRQAIIIETFTSINQ